MTMPEKDKISDAIADRDLITKAFAEGVKDALIRHKETGNPVVVMRDGEIIWIKAEELLAGYPVKIAWLTDLHLNCVGRSEVEDLCTVIHRAKPDALLITGDIAASKYLCRYLEYLAENIRKPIYFVLGNHDYYHSSIKAVNSAVAKVVKKSQYLVWLSRAGVVELSPDTCLIGHEGLADGRLGDPLGSDVELNDYRLIEELQQPSKELRLKVQNRLGDTAARHLRKQLKSVAAAGRYKKVIVALHVPPGPAACWHLGKNTDDNHLPHFGCKATGVVLTRTSRNQLTSCYNANHYSMEVVSCYSPKDTATRYLV